MNKLSTLLILPIVALAVAACGSSNSSSSSTAAAAPPPTTSAPATTSTPAAPPAAPTGPKISSATISPLGAVLVNAQGRTLYTFAPDKATKVTCTGGCAAIWPPAVVSSGEKAAASGAVKQSLLGSDPNPAGGQVITYAGWPLYTYVADGSAGKASGQAINLNGGLWYTISPAGTVIKTKP